LLSTKQQVARWHIGDLDLTAQWNLLKHKKQHGVIDETLKADLQLWYLHEGVAAQAEVIDMMLDLDQIIEE
jgi:hypothetical protein